MGNETSIKESIILKNKHKKHGNKKSTNAR